MNIQELKIDSQFVAYVEDFLDGGRGQGAEYGAPRPIAVVDSVEDGFKLLAEVADGGRCGVMEIAGPARINGKVQLFPVVWHKMPKPAAPKPVRKAAAKKKAAKIRK